MAQFHNTYNGNSAPTKAEIAGAMGLPESDARVTDALDRKNQSQLLSWRFNNAQRAAFSAAMTMMQGAHSDASAHSATGAHDMLAHPDLHAASAELGTTTLHDQLNLHGASFSTQMHV